MAKKYLDQNGLAYLWEKIKNLASGKVDKETGKGLSSNDYTSTEKTKLSGIATGAQVNVLEGIQVGGDTVTPTNKIANIPVMGAASSSAAGTKGVVPAPASGDQGKFLRGDGTWQTVSQGEVNQNAFSNVKVGSTTIAADTKTDTLELVAGSNVTLTPDASGDKVTIAATDTTYTPASATPNMDGTGAVGTSAKYAREDHVHPTDTSRASASDLEDLSELITNNYATKSDVDNVFASTSVDGVTLGSADNVHYGVCSTGASTAAKTVDCTGFKLVTGSRIVVKFSSTNSATASSLTLNVNSTGAKSIKYHGSNLPISSVLTAGCVYEFIYDGTNYELVGDVNGDLSLGNGVSSNNYQIKLKIGNTVIDTMTISNANTTSPGMMSSSDKTKLNKLVFDSSNKIDSSILPSYVDDVIEAYARSGQTALSSAWLATGSATGDVITPETGKIYILMADSGDYSANDQFRWGGTTYVKLSDGGVSAITNAEIDTICV